MKNLIIISTAILLMFAITNSYAKTNENYYKRKLCKFTDTDGHSYRILRITKIYDKNLCLQLRKTPSSEAGCSIDCVIGDFKPKKAKETMDQLYGPLFKEEPTDNIYIHFKNSKIKLESTLIFDDPPSDIPAALVETAVKKLKLGGADQLKVVYPKKNK